MPKLEAQNLVPAQPAVGGQPAVAAESGDKSLPDPSTGARLWLSGGIVLAVGAAILMNSVFHWTTKEWVPPKGDFNFAIFAAFYAAAQIIERAMELVAPLLPAYTGQLTGDAKVAQAKADRAKETLAIASVAGVVTSNAFDCSFSASWASMRATPLTRSALGW